MLSPGKRSGVRCCPDLLPRWPQGTGRKGEPGHRLKHLLPPPASQESYRASWTCGDITGPHLFKLTMEAFCPALLRASFHSSSSPRIMYLEKGETPMPIRRDYFRENMKVTSCPRRHARAWALQRGGQAWTRLEVSPLHRGHMKVGESEKAVLLQLPSAPAPAPAITLLT